LQRQACRSGRAPIVDGGFDGAFEAVEGGVAVEEGEHGALVGEVEGGFGSAAFGYREAVMGESGSAGETFACVVYGGDHRGVAGWSVCTVHADNQASACFAGTKCLSISLNLLHRHGAH
jgi:hypothetical protein